ncbi:neuropeptides capa receptor-like [Mercenaria mercenaria]|uniref:neuropeptides capa receptor-like n=1 Tax=Mercenaria mercenaria TaxID=6596 RepID=UPI00234EAB8C|nr:neuropeptides capa receptor-like [Mercenaria mercenaria]XP_045180247.2 neuropeptides capa receptor-like [Mercenaria mercenaria]
MNNTERTNGQQTPTLDDLNNEELDTLIPTVFYLSIISLSGMVGNSLVIHIYRTRFTFSNVQCFVLSMAAVDLFSCCVAIPLEIVTVLDQYTFKLGWLCKLARFTNGVCTNSSTFLLIFIAIDRFRKIWKPFGWQIKAGVAKCLCVLAVVFALIISWPAIIIYGKDTFDIQEFNLTGSDCGTNNDVKETPFPSLYTLALAILFIAGVILLVILYCMIGQKVRSHVHNLNKGLGRKQSQAYLQNQATARKTTFVMFLVTLVFILSFLPHLIVRQFKSNFADDSSTGSKAVYRILTRSYFLNCAVNPIIYSIFDTRFRRACKRKGSEHVSRTNDSSANLHMSTYAKNETCLASEIKPPSQ